MGDRFCRFLSNDSSFYGDEETKARLEARAANFDPAPYWESHEHQFHVVAAKAQEEHEEKKKAEEEECTKAKVREQQSISATGLNLPGKAMTGSQSEPPIHRQTQSSSLRADESLEAFLVRLCPSTVFGEGLWIQIDRPSISPVERSQGDRDTFMARGQEILNKLSLEPNVDYT